MLLTKADLIDDAVRITDGLAMADADFDHVKRRALRRYTWKEIDEALRGKTAYALLASLSPVAADRALAALNGYGKYPEEVLSVCVSGNDPILIFGDGSLLSEGNAPWWSYNDYFTRLIDNAALSGCFVEIAAKRRCRKSLAKYVKELLIAAGAAEVRISEAHR